MSDRKEVTLPFADAEKVESGGVLIVHDADFDAMGLAALRHSFEDQMALYSDNPPPVVAFEWFSSRPAAQNAIAIAPAHRVFFQLIDKVRPETVVFLSMVPCARLLRRLRSAGVKVASAKMPYAQVDGHSPRLFKKVPLIISLLDAVFVELPSGAQPLESLGADNMRYGRDMCRVVATIAYNEEELSILQGSLGRRSVWAATHIERDELNLIVEAQAELASKDVRALLLLHPQHEADVVACQAYLKSARLTYALYSENDAPEDPVQVLLDDELVSAGLWHHLAQATFVGGSLSLQGTLGPHEAIMASGCPVIFGPHLGAHSQELEAIIKRAGARQINSAHGLANAVSALFETQTAAQQAHVAWQELSSADATRMALVNWSLEGKYETGQSDENTGVLVS